MHGVMASAKNCRLLPFLANRDFACHGGSLPRRGFRRQKGLEPKSQPGLLSEIKVRPPAKHPHRKIAKVKRFAEGRPIDMETMRDYNAELWAV
jgi:hypothetical protein